MPDIAVVINFDFPPAIGGQQGVESYVHRIGRTGRKGGTGRGKVRPAHTLARSHAQPWPPFDRPLHGRTQFACPAVVPCQPPGGLTSECRSAMSPEGLHVLHGERRQGS